MAQLVISAVGAVVGGFIGYWVGGPGGVAEGAEIGWTLGGVAGALLIHGKGPQPGDLKVQDSAYGKPIPWLYGMYRAAGNVIWAGQPINDSDGGKGSAPSQAKVSMSFAVGICEGPITGIRRIWANGKLIYDISNPSNFEALSGSAQMTTNFTTYLGDEFQTADPTMEAALGVGNVPAHRGLAYVVFNGLDLSPWGNYMPSLSFEVVVSGVPPVYSNSIGSTFSHPTPYGTLFQCSHLHAWGGTATGYGYFLGYDGLVSADLTPYGANTVAVVPPNPVPSASFIATGNSDIDGIWSEVFDGTNNVPAWFLDDGGPPTVIMHGLTGTGVGPSGGSTTFWKDSTDFFCCRASGASHIYRVDYFAGGLLATSTIASAFVMIGGSAAFVYVADITNGLIYQLARLTLAVVNSWSNTSFRSICIGCVLNDRAVYVGLTSQGIWLFSPATGALTFVGASPFARPSSMAVINPTLIVLSYCDVVNNSATIGYMTESLPQTDVALSSIAADICARAGMSAGQYDVSQLTDRVTGYAITNHSNARGNIAPLMATYFFDAVDSDGLIKFVKRGSAPIAAIAYGDLGASSSVGDTANQNPVTEVIMQEVDLPRTLTLTYSGLNNDYQPTTQRAFRGNTRSNKDATLSAPIVLSDDNGLMRVQAMLWATWAGRKTFNFTLPLSYLQYEPGDVLTLPGDKGQAYTVRIVRCAVDGQGALLYTASLEQPDIYPSAAYNVQGGAPAGFTPQTLDYSGPTVLAVLDVPPLRDSDTSPGLYLAASGYAANWPGVVVDISRDDITFTDLESISNASVIGFAQTALPNFSGGNQPDELSSVTVVTTGGALASVNYTNFLAGVNAAYLGGELLYFRNATQTGANTYLLTGFLRGRVGTEQAMATHASSELFVLLDAAKLQVATVGLSDIGAPLYFEPHLLNLFANQPVVAQVTTPQNARVKPLSPALFVAGHGSAASVSDISLSWIRRARVNAQWNDGADVPLDESVETYTLNIYSGSTLKRTATVSAATAYTYTAANITADGFSAGNLITFTIAQNSDQGVLGYAATATITR
jgi:hypothetical protein